MYPRNTVKNFFDRIEKVGDCWEWMGTVGVKGYGYLRWSGKRHFAHRISYEIVKGKIPEGLQIDHLCRNRKCVNPQHLEAITPKENVNRGHACKKNDKFCRNGHEKTAQNTAIVKFKQRGREYEMRRCVICYNDYMKRFLRKKRDEQKCPSLKKASIK